MITRVLTTKSSIIHNNHGQLALSDPEHPGGEQHHDLSYFLQQTVMKPGVDASAATQHEADPSNTHDGYQEHDIAGDDDHDEYGEGEEHPDDVYGGEDQSHDADGYEQY